MYSILRIQKFTMGSVRGIQYHDNREKKSLSNKNIDTSKSHLNSNLIECKNFYQETKKNIDALELKKAVRKDAVVMCQVLITASPEFFEKTDKLKEDLFFHNSLNFLKKTYGSENIISATVHRDEKTPHMHVNFTPITEDKRLSAKSLITKTHLKSLHTNFYKEVGHKYDLQRGENNTEKFAHLEMQEFKLKTGFKAIDEKNKDLAENEQKYNEKSKDLAEKSEILAENEQKYNEKSEILAENEQKLEEKSKDLEKKDKKLQKIAETVEKNYTLLYENKNFIPQEIFERQSKGLFTKETSEERAKRLNENYICAYTNKIDKYENKIKEHEATIKREKAYSSNLEKRIEHDREITDLFYQFDRKSQLEIITEMKEDIREQNEEQEKERARQERERPKSQDRGFER